MRGATGGEGITLIQGPPGTGKTHCALRIITKWLEQRKAELLNVVKQRRERVAQVEGALVRLTLTASACLGFWSERWLGTALTLVKSLARVFLHLLPLVSKATRWRPARADVLSA